MQKLAVAIAAVATLTGASAFAADMAVKAPPLPPLAVPNWTGFYIGGALGGKWANTTWTTTSTSDLPGTIVDVSSPRNFDPSGFRASGYAGYNWQIAPWVVGLEGDVAWSNNTATVAGIPGCTMQCFPGAPGPGVNVSSVKVGWDASLRARLGHMITPDLLIYGTGGVAWQEIVSSGTCQHSLPNPQCTVVAGNLSIRKPIKISSPAGPSVAASKRCTATGCCAPNTGFLNSVTRMMCFRFQPLVSLSGRTSPAINCRCRRISRRLA
jgi:outer membrane immunogenic protein